MGKGTANSSEIVHTVLGSLEAYLHSNPPDYRFQVESLLELLYYAFTEYNITESPEFKAKIGPLDRKLRDLAETDEAADEYMNVVYSLCAAYERQSLCVKNIIVTTFCSARNFCGNPELSMIIFIPAALLWGQMCKMPVW